MTYESKAAQQAQASNFGSPDYWSYLDQNAKEHRDHFLAKGDQKQADSMMSRSLSDCLKGNDGI